jgi:phosphoribosylanthranilate isomerase
MTVHVKICGITNVDDALAAADAGASAIGLNFVPASPRCIHDENVARDIVAAIAASKAKVLVVGVVADLPLAEMIAQRDRVGLGCLQLHGDEPNASLLALLPHAYKAVRIRDANDVAHARAFGGEHLLVDAFVPGTLGGTGKQVDFALVAPLAKERKLTLAGGLTKDNVGAAIAAVHPFCVDVASGVESSPGKKDHALVRAFISAARSVREG